MFYSTHRLLVEIFHPKVKAHITETRGHTKARPIRSDTPSHLKIGKQNMLHAHTYLL